MRVVAALWIMLPPAAAAAAAEKAEPKHKYSNPRGQDESESCTYDDDEAPPRQTHHLLAPEV